jgi:hypothetical protein
MQIQEQNHGLYPHREVFTSLILEFISPSTPVEQVTSMPGLHCKKVALMVSFHFSPYSFDRASDVHG